MFSVEWDGKVTVNSSGAAPSPYIHFGICWCSWTYCTAKRLHMGLRRALWWVFLVLSFYVWVDAKGTPQREWELIFKQQISPCYNLTFSLLEHSAWGLCLFFTFRVMGKSAWSASAGPMGWSVCSATAARLHTCTNLCILGEEKETREAGDYGKRNPGMLCKDTTIPFPLSTCCSTMHEDFKPYNMN